MNAVPHIDRPIEAIVDILHRANSDQQREIARIADLIDRGEYTPPAAKLVFDPSEVAKNIERCRALAVVMWEESTIAVPDEILTLGWLMSDLLARADVALKRCAVIPMEDLA